MKHKKYGKNKFNDCMPLRVHCRLMRKAFADSVKFLQSYAIEMHSQIKGFYGNK